MCYILIPTPHKKCEHPALQTCTNKKRYEFISPLEVSALLTRPAKHQLPSFHSYSGLLPYPLYVVAFSCLDYKKTSILPFICPRISVLNMAFKRTFQFYKA